MARLILKAPYYKPGHKTESGRSRGGYAEYIATREGVEILRGGMLGYIGERQGSNGLFSDEGEKINLSAIRREIDEHQGNVWGMIISLKREDWFPYCDRRHTNGDCSEGYSFPLRYHFCVSAGG